LRAQERADPHAMGALVGWVGRCLGAPGIASEIRLGALFGLAVLLAASGPAGAASDVLVPAQTPFGYNVGIDYETDVAGRIGRSIPADLNQITQYFGLVRTYHDTANPNSTTPIIDSYELQVIQYAMTHPAMNLVIGTFNSALVMGNTGSFCGVASGSFSAGLMDSPTYTDAWVQMLIGAFGGSTAAVQQSVKTILLGNEPDLPGTFIPGPTDPNYSNYVNTWIPNAIANLKTSLSNAGLGNIPISVALAFSPVSDSTQCPGSSAVSAAIPQYISSHWSASWNGGQPFVLYNHYSTSSPPTFDDIIGYMQKVIDSLNGSNEAFVGETGVQSPGGDDTREAAFYQEMFAFLGNERLNSGRTLPVFAFQAFDLPAFSQTYGLFSQDANFQPTGPKPGIAITSFQLFALSVSVSGGGTVTSNPAGINCGSTCGASFTSGTQVALSASPGPGFTFNGWSGACSGTGSCTVTMNAAESVTATFVQAYSLSVSVTGSGTVTSSPAGINCGSTCSANFAQGTQVTLSATPASGWGFTGWGGACSGAGSCVVTMNAAQSVTATFVQSVYTLSVSVSGNGTVTSSPAGINCGATCSASYNSGTPVMLTATPSGGTTFFGWTGACSGSGSCTVTMNSSQNVAATFVSGGTLSNQTWVSAATGADSNPCTRSSPCLTFAGAIAQTTAGGEINCLDAGGFGAATITKALTINCEATLGSVLASGTNGIVVQAGPNDVVTLNGLEFEGLNTGLNAVRFLSGKELHMHKFQIRDFTNSGIDIEPSNSTRVFLADGYISGCGVGGTGFAAILIKANSGANTSISINHLQMESNLNGVFADGSGGGGISHVQVKDSVISASSNNGISISSTGPSFTADVVDNIIRYNVNSGAAVTGAAATLKLGGNTITNNVTGVASSGGTLQSFQNNMITDNGVDGIPITAVPGYSGTLQ
jgi:hypothetical protein